MTDRPEGDQDDSEIPSSRGEILFFQTEDGGTRIECRFEEETIWLSQALIAELYQKDVRTVNEHLRNIFEEGELDPGATIRKFRIVRQEGDRQVARVIDHYALDAILAVGYRVRSRRGTQFRRWATTTLRGYLIKGFVMDDERLKNPPVPGSGVPDHFDELLERIRDIRASERRMYLRVRDIFAMAADYERSSADTSRFFQIIQNKLHFAATGMTAPELIRSRADHLAPNMGLMSFKSGEVRRGDVTIAKNYLHEPEIDELNRIVVMWLDYAEDQARRRKQVFMKDWEERLDAFLAFNERRVLPDAGKVTRRSADAFAKDEYARFAERRRLSKETDGEQEAVRALEQLARDLERRGKPDDDGSNGS